MDICKLYRRASERERAMIRKFWCYWLKWGLVIFGALWVITALIEYFVRHR